nr:zinc finger BED domain-containing protein RICESLEEPER 2-like [Ipomoea batatas]
MFMVGKKGDGEGKGMGCWVPLRDVNYPSLNTVFQFHSLSLWQFKVQFFLQSSAFSRRPGLVTQAVVHFASPFSSRRLQHSGESVPHKPARSGHLGEGNKETTTAPPRLRLTNVLHGRFEAPPTADFNDDNDECENVDNLDVNCDGVGNENLDVGDEKDALYDLFYEYVESDNMKNRKGSFSMPHGELSVTSTCSTSKGKVVLSGLSLYDKYLDSVEDATPNKLELDIYLEEGVYRREKEAKLRTGLSHGSCYHCHFHLASPSSLNLLAAAASNQASSEVLSSESEHVATAVGLEDQARRSAARRPPRPSNRVLFSSVNDVEETSDDGDSFPPINEQH